VAITTNSRGIRFYNSWITGDKKYRSLAATHPVALSLFYLDDAKVLLFFDMSKFFGKKMQELCYILQFYADFGYFPC